MECSGFVKHVMDVVYVLAIRGGARNFPTGADSSDDGAKIWLSGYYKCQKYPKKLLFAFRGGSMLRWGL